MGWRRLASRVAVCLVVGAVMTVLVAWGCTLMFKQRWMGVPWVDTKQAFSVPTPAEWPNAGDRNRAAVKRSTGAEETRFHFIFIVEEQRGEEEVEVRGSSIILKRAGAGAAIRTVDLRIWHAGWPLHALRHEQWNETEELIPNNSGKVLRSEGHPTSIWRLGLNVGYHRLGLRPLWPGFAIDTLLYAIVVFALWVVPSLIRRCGRRRRRACLACGYDLRGLGAGGACPECGG